MSDSEDIEPNVTMERNQSSNASVAGVQSSPNSVVTEVRCPPATETVVSDASSSTEGRSGDIDDDVLSNPRAVSAILEELELMRPTYVFSEDTVRRAEGSLAYPLQYGDQSSSPSASEDDSDSCISPPASRSSRRRCLGRPVPVPRPNTWSPLSRGFHSSGIQRLFEIAPMQAMMADMPTENPRRAPFFEYQGNGVVAPNSSRTRPSLYRI